MADKSPGPIPVPGEAAETDLMQWGPCHAENGLPVGREKRIQKAYEINHYMFGSMRSVVSVGRGWCDIFMSRNGESTLRTAYWEGL